MCSETSEAVGKMTRETLEVQGVSKKRDMSFGIRMFSPFHLATQTVPNQNLNCLKSARVSMNCGTGLEYN